METKIKGKLYLITNILNQRYYVGITTRSIKHRWEGHKRAAEGEKILNLKGLHAAMRKFGLENFKITQLGKYDSLKKLAKAEVQAIKKYHSLTPNGYNLNRGGGINPRFGPYEVEGIEYFSLESLAQDYDLLPITVQKRMHSGKWTIRQACGLDDPPLDKRSNAQPMIIGGIEFRSKMALVSYFGIDKRTFDLRVNRLGWSIEEAVGLKQRIGRSIILEGKNLVHEKQPVNFTTWTKKRLIAVYAADGHWKRPLVL